MCYEDKLTIIQIGRPLCDLKLEVQQKGRKTFTRHFSTKMYDATSWLCGCSKLQKLFCWPCLLFSNEKNVWSKAGFDDLTNFHKAQKRHSLSQSHIQAQIQLKQFGKTRIEFSLCEQSRLSVEAHNETVRKNRRIISHFIKVACFLGKQELAFRGHDESPGSLNRGNYVELLYERADMDPELQEHLNNSTVFSGLSSNIQNDIILSVSEYMIQEIKKDIRQAGFVAIILDETTDITTKSQLSTVIRYVNNDSVEERFVSFTNVSDDRSASALAQHVFSILTEYDCEKKLIAQTYDGAAVMAGEHRGLQVRVREKCPQAVFVHCYAHRLNLVLSQTVSYIKECKIFFITLAGFGTFFSKSTKRTEALDSEVKKRFPSLVATRWNYNSRLLETVYEYRKEINNVLKSMSENADKWDTETVITAAGLISKLQDFNFNFLLVIFSLIFPHSDTLFQVLQKKAFDINFCVSKIENFTAHLTRLREDFDSIWDKTEMAISHIDNDLLPSKRRKLETISGQDNKMSYRRLFFEIIDVIKSNVSHRFSDACKLKFLRLLDVKNFQNFQKHFPEEELSNLKESYGNFFDFPRLRSELSVLYKEEEMHKESIIELHRYLINSDLEDIIPEVCRLVQLIVTIPASSASAERSFSALKRIKTYLRNSQDQDRMSSLALLSIEKALLAKLRRKSSFYDDVIDIFARKCRRIELHFKN